MIGKMKDGYVKIYASALAEDGKRLIDKAFARADFNKNKTQNLHDSYGSCVFYDRKEVSGTRRYVGRKAVVGRRNPSGEIVYGREEIDKYFDSYTPSTRGFELVTVAAIFYAEILEKGMGRLKRKYRVISGLDGDMALLASKTGGKVININI